MVSKRGSQSPPRKSSSPSRGASASPTRSPSKRSRSPSTQAKATSSKTNGSGGSPFGLQTPSPRRIETDTSGRENVSPLRRRAPSSSPPKLPTNQDWSDTPNQPSENGNAFATPQRGRRVSREHHVRTVSPLKKSAESNSVATPSGDWDDDVEAKEQSVAEALQANERGPSSPPAAGTIQNVFGSSPLTPRSISMATKNLSDSPLKPGASPTAAPVDWEEKIAKAQEEERKAVESRGDDGGRKNKRKAGDEDSETEDGDAKRVKDGEGKVVYSVVDKDTENVTIAHGAEDRNKCHVM